MGVLVPSAPSPPVLCLLGMGLPTAHPKICVCLPTAT